MRRLVCPAGLALSDPNGKRTRARLREVLRPLIETVESIAEKIR
jgi:hypothetical protein